MCRSRIVNPIVHASLANSKCPDRHGAYARIRLMRHRSDFADILRELTPDLDMRSPEADY
jgi:hypothetical protein